MTKVAQPTTNEIDACLPQLHCTECGYPSCKDYARAIHHAGVAINRCPPGDARTIKQLAKLTGRDAVPIDQNLAPRSPRAYALIVESECIGCTLCINVCPVDAIIGAKKRLHTVIQDHCTGCNLCIAACPVDCINMHTWFNGMNNHNNSAWEEFTNAEISCSRERFDRRQRRLRSHVRSKAAISNRANMREEIRASVARVYRTRESQDGRR